jgi:hypothetical protein
LSASLKLEQRNVIWWVLGYLEVFERHATKIAPG